MDESLNALVLAWRAAARTQVEDRAHSSGDEVVTRFMDVFGVDEGSALDSLNCNEQEITQTRAALMREFLRADAVETLLELIGEMSEVDRFLPHDLLFEVAAEEGLFQTARYLAGRLFPEDPWARIRAELQISTHSKDPADLARLRSLILERDGKEKLLVVNLPHSFAQTWTISRDDADLQQAKDLAEAIQSPYLRSRAFRCIARETCSSEDFLVALRIIHGLPLLEQDNEFRALMSDVFVRRLHGALSRDDLDVLIQGFRDVGENYGQALQRHLERAGLLTEQ